MSTSKNPSAADNQQEIPPSAMSEYDYSGVRVPAGKPTGEGIGGHEFSRRVRKLISKGVRESAAERIVHLEVVEGLGELVGVEKRELLQLREEFRDILKGRSSETTRDTPTEVER